MYNLKEILQIYLLLTNSNISEAQKKNYAIYLEL